MVAAVPGQSTALIIRQSIRGGKRAGIATVLGNESGVFVWGCAAAFGFTALLAAAWAVYETFYYSLYVWCVQWLRTFFSHRKVRRRMEQISGTVMLGLAARMVIDNS